MTAECVDIEFAKLKISFPAIEPDFINVLSERMIASGFTDKRLKDAVGRLIDNFQYKKPNIADIISYDKRIKLYTYNEAYRMIEKGEAAGFEEFEIRELNGNKYRVRKKDLT